MNEMKQIVLARIDNIFELIRALKHPQGNKTRLFRTLMQKNEEIMRSQTQSKMLTNFNKGAKFTERAIKELGNTVGSIMNAYDSTMGDIPKTEAQLFTNLQIFFNKHGFRHKNKHLRVLANQRLDMEGAFIILSWLCEWSRKKYCEILEQASSREIIGNKKAESKTESVRRTQDSLEKQSSPEKDHFGKMLNIWNRTAVYGFVLDQLEEYYKLIDYEGLDRNYLKNIRRRGRKQKILEIPNIKRVIEVLVKSNENQNIAKSLKEYSSSFSNHRQNLMKDKDSNKKKAKYLISKSSPPTMEVKRNQTEKREENQSPPKQLRLSFDHRTQKQKKLEQLKSPQQIKIESKIQKLGKLQKQTNIRLPTLKKIIQKQEKWESKAIIRFPTQNQIPEEEYLGEGENIRFSQRSQFKAVLPKNYFSNRQGSKRKFQILPKDEMKKLFLIDNIQKAETEESFVKSALPYKSAKKCVDLKQLRQKAKALLKNFNIVQMYTKT